MSDVNDPTANSASRRSFLGAATIGAGAAVLGGATAASAEVRFPAQRMLYGGGGSAAGAVNRTEVELFDCEVEGKLPDGLSGAFYRVGPDPQYPKSEQWQSDIGFDGEGHVSMFHFKDGHVDYRTKYAKTQRWKAQHAARKSLFGMYRNPTTDDPSVAGLSRGTANTQVWYHHKKLFALKEDSPPVAMDPLTLETTDDYYLFGGGFKGLTHTAHPKNDPHTGRMVGFGYQATGLASNDIYIYEANPDGRIAWDAMVKCPYSAMLHDFVVTERHIAFQLFGLVTNMDNIRAGKVHYAFDSTMPAYVGVMPRGGDAKDIRWVQGPMYFCTHLMGAWSEGDKLTFDMDGGESNQFPFFPNMHEPFDGQKAAGRVRRFTMDLSKKNRSYEVQTLYPEVTGALARQDDRYHTVPYKIGFLNASSRDGGGGWAMFDHSRSKASMFSLADYSLQEMCFVPRKKGAPEGDGFLIGVANSNKERGRSDLVIADTQDLAAPPVARVKLPFRAVSQIHGFWVPEDQLPTA